MAYKPLRYAAQGYKHGVPVKSVFKSLAAAKRFAETLEQPEIYDMIERKEIL
jgi:hypothetical protein